VNHEIAARLGAVLHGPGLIDPEGCIARVGWRDKGFAALHALQGLAAVGDGFDLERPHCAAGLVEGQ